MADPQPTTNARRRAIATLALLCACLAVREEKRKDKGTERPAVAGKVDETEDDRELLKTLLAQDAGDWAQLFWLAGGHLVTPVLAGALRRKRLFDALPCEVRNYLDTVQSLNRERNQMLRNQLTAIAAALNRIDIQPVLLKGAVTLAVDDHPGAEDRVMSDLDLRIPDERLAEATAVIEALGYQTDHASWRWALPKDRVRAHHGIPLLHPSLPVKVELHRRMLAHPADDARLQVGIQPDVVTLGAGPTVLIPDRATRLVHNALHAQISHRQWFTRTLGLRQLAEFAALARHEVASLRSVDWHIYVRPERERVLADYWALAERWLGLPFPESLRRSPHAARELWLVERVATQASWRRLVDHHDALHRLPGRVVNLAIRTVVMPGYLPMKIRTAWSRLRLHLPS